MVRHSARRWTLAILALGWAGPASADAITQSQPAGTAVSPLFATGNVATDMPASSKSVTVIPGQPENGVGQPQWMTSAGLVNGYVMKDLRLSYDAKTDTLSVGVNYWGVAGNVDGSPDGQTNAKTLAAGGSNPAHLGGDKSITVAFTPYTAQGTAAAPVLVAGVPADKSSSPQGSLDGFKVAAYQASPNGLSYSYGQTLTANQGSLAYDPSSAHPGFEFTIKNFSKIPGLNALQNGFYVSAYTGSQQTLIVGKSMIADAFVAAPQAQSLSPPAHLDPTPLPTPKPVVDTPSTPEPATLLAWGVVVGGAAWRYRRRLRPASEM